MIKNIFILLLAGTFFTPSCFAQGKQQEVELQFVSFPKAADPKPVELLIAGEGNDRKGIPSTIQVEIPTNRISRVYSVARTRDWALGEMTTDDEGKTVFEAYGQVKALTDSKQLILVIRKGRDNASGFELIPLPNSEEHRGGATFSLFNASDLQIGGTFSQSKFWLNPGKITTIRPEPSYSKGIYDYCDTKFYFRTEAEVRPFYSSTLRLNDQARSFIFFYQDPDQGKLRIHSIRNYLSASLKPTN